MSKGKITVHLEEYLIDRLKEIKKDEGITISFFVEQAIKEKLERNYENKNK